MLALRRHAAFSLIELLVVISVIAILIGILVPALGGGQEAARKAANQSQLGEIHTGLAFYAPENRGWYVGLDSTGSPLANTDFDFTTDGSGVFVGPRVAQLIQKKYITGEKLVSPKDGDMTAWSRDGTFNTADVADHMSYAMLAISAGNGGVRWARDADWRDSNNPQAPVVSDRNTGSNAGGNASSVWTQTNSGDWEGHIAYNDGSVSYEQDEVATRTRYGSENENPTDNLFVGESGFGDGQGTEAAMTYDQNGTAAAHLYGHAP